MVDAVQYSFLADIHGRPLDGGKFYSLLLPVNMPPCNFWSLIVYDSETGLMINTDQPWPSVYSNCNGLKINKDGSVDAWFGPKAEPGKQHNWIKTIPGKSWYLMLRLYDINPTHTDNFWRPGELIETKQFHLNDWRK